MSIFKRRRQPITHSLFGVQPTLVQEQQYVIDILKKALKEIISEGDRRVVNKYHLIAIAEEAFRDIRR